MKQGLLLAWQGVTRSTSGGAGAAWPGSGASARGRGHRTSPLFFLLWVVLEFVTSISPFLKCRN